MGLTRREALKIGIFGTGALVLPTGRLLSAGGANRIAASLLPTPYTRELKIPPVAYPVRTDDTNKTDYYQISMRAMPQSILDGGDTVMLGYDGIVPGPTIHVDRYRKSVVRFINYLPAKHPTFGYQPDTSVHLHGSASLPQFDGYANDITRPNQYKDYQYPNYQEARTLWYHDHAAHKTAKNAYSGLAAFYIIHDDLERSLPLPKGPYDVPLMITDAMFSSDNQLMWIEDERQGMNGDVILVNGQPWPFMQVERRKYRFRILVASVSRDYRWALDSGDPFTVIASDAGLFQHPQVVNRFRHGNAERYEVVIDFAKYQPGQRVRLLNLGNDNNINYEHTGQVMEFRVVEATSPDTSYVPDVMNTEDPTMKLQPAQAPNPPRVINLHRSNGTWLINNKRWEDVEASGFTFALAEPMLGATEIWELRNDSGGWHHPLHIHLIDMKILARSVKLGPWQPPLKHELGPKDVIYLGENERVRVITNFGPHTGRYMLHCHNLVHEDHSMMGQFRVQSPGAPDPHPVTTARPKSVAYLPAL